MSLAETKPHAKKLYKQQEKQTTYHNKTTTCLTYPQNKSTRSVATSISPNLT
jgi:hypothetical protein